MTILEEYYNKFNEQKRFDSRHGQVEFRISLKYIHECIDLIKARDNKSNEDINILDIGAGTGRYSIALAKEGYNVTAVELVKHNVSRLKQYAAEDGVVVDAKQGNALNLKKIEDKKYDITLIFGPMYHLISFEDKCKAMEEAKKKTKDNGYILVAYCMNDYAVITYAFKEGHIKECMDSGRFTEDFKTISKEENLYDYLRISDIDKINEACSLCRYKIISPDGAANYIRDNLKKLSDDEFEMFIRYQETIAERSDLIGSGGHCVDILQL